MKIELENKIRKHFILAWLILIVTVITSSLFIFSFISNVENIVTSKNKKNTNVMNFSGSFLMIMGFIFLAIYIVLWAIAIINAISINSITNNSTLLIVFTIINIQGIAMLILTVMERNKMQSGTHELNIKMDENIDYSNKKNALKNALMQDVITSREYSTKLMHLDEKFHKKSK